MSRVIAPFAQFFDGEGNPLANGFLYFFESGTTSTNKNTYADVDQTLPNSNPLQLDAEGRCSNVFGIGIYRVVLYAENPVTHLPGELLQVFDPVQAEYAPLGSEGHFSQWDATLTYQVGDIVIQDGRYYRSIAADNLNNPPDSTPTHWEEIDFIRYWNTNVTYLTDNVAVYGSQIYFSLADANTGNQPDTSPAWWQPVGSGTVLVNWEEFGTIFQPVTSGYDLGSATNYVGTAYIDAFGMFPETPASMPSTDFEVANKIYADTLEAESMHWLSDWVPGTYQSYDVVRDDNWTMIANQVTDERPAPQPSGDSIWVRDDFSPPAFSTTSSTEAVLYIGQRYTFDPGFLVKSIRVYFPSQALGLHVKIWAIYNPATDPRVINLYPGTTIDALRVEKWLELPIGDTFVAAGTIIDVVMVLRAPDEELDFTFTWAYSKTNGDPGPGQIYHQGGSDADQIRVHEQDNTLVDRSLSLDNIGPGSKIYMADSQYEWEVLSASEAAGIYTFIVDPGARASNATTDFTFAYYGTSAIYYVYNTDLFISDARIEGYFGNEYDGSNAAYINENGYGIDVQVQNVMTSDHWEVVAQPFGTGSVNIGTSLGFWEESSEYWQPKTTSVGYLGASDHLIQGLYLGDSSPIYLGDAQDASIQFDGTDLAVACSGDVILSPADLYFGSEDTGDTTLHFWCSTFNTYRRIYWDTSALEFKLSPYGYSDAKIWHQNNDGSGSGLDADFLDNHHASYFAALSLANIFTDIQTIYVGESGQTGVNASARLIIEDDTNAIINILVPNTSFGGILIGDDGGTGRGGMLYVHSTDALDFYTAGTVKFSISSTGDITASSATMTLGGDTVYHTGNDSNLAKLDSANTFTANQTIESTAPRLYFSETDTVTTAQLVLQGGDLTIANDDIYFSGEGSNNVATFVVRYGGSYENIYHAGLFDISDYVLGNGTGNGEVIIRVDDADFILQDTTDTVTNWFWRDWSGGFLYIGSADALINCRSNVYLASSSLYLDNNYPIYFDNLSGGQVQMLNMTAGNIFTVGSNSYATDLRASTLTFNGSVASFLTFDNDWYIQAKEVGGTARNIFGINTSDQVLVGNASNALNLRSNGTLEIQNANVILNNNYKLQVEDTVGTAYNVAQLTSSDIVQLGNISYPTLISSDDEITLSGVTEITPATVSGLQPGLILSDPGEGGGEGLYIQFGQNNTADLGRIGIASQSISTSGDSCYMYFSTKNESDASPVVKMSLSRNGDISLGAAGNGDTRISFYDETGATYRDILWDDSNADWYVEDSGGTNRKMWHEGDNPSLGSGNGISGTIDTTATQTITVTNGIITAIA